MTINQLLDIIYELPLEKRNNPKIVSIKQQLIRIKHSPDSNGFGGQIQLDNYKEILEIIKRLSE